MFNSNNVPFTMPVSPANTNDGMWGGEGGWFWIIILILIFGWGGYGNGGFGNQGTTSVYEGYVLSNDMSTLSRQMSDGFNSQERKLDGIANGICSLGYDQLNQMNGINTNIMSSANAIQTQLSECCCQTQQNIKDTQYAIASQASEINRGVERGFSDTNYNIASQANGITTAIANGFCQTNFNAQTNTRDIVDSQNANTRAILDKLCQMENNAKDEKIADQAQQISALQLAASQAAQNNYLVNQLRTPTPIPAYVVASPYCNCNTGCGC